MGSRLSNWTRARVSRDWLLKGQDEVLTCPPSPYHEGLRPGSLLSSSSTLVSSGSLLGGGWKKGPGQPGNGRLGGAVM